MAQQGPPPRGSSRQPDEQRNRTSRAGRPDRRRADRPDRAAGWQQHDAFAADELDLPPWAEPSLYQARPAGTRHRRPAPSGPERSGYADSGGGYQDSDTGYRDSDNGRLQVGAGRHGPGRRYRDPQEDYDGPGGYRRPEEDYRLPAGYRDPGGYQEPDGYGYRDDRGRHRTEAAAAGDIEAIPGRPGRSALRRGRAATTRLRKSRRRVYRLAGVAIVLVVLAAGGWILFGQPKATPSPYVTTLQAGEFKSVPDACTAVGAAVLGQYLPGPSRKVTQEQSASNDSQCSFVIDKKPVFLVLEVSAQAFQPFAAASGDGSATSNAQDNFALARQGLATPPKRSPLPPAVISPIPKMGQQAFAAFQPEHVTGIVTDVVTVVVRERNVLITVSLSGQDSGHGFGPVSAATLEAGTRAVAASVLAKVRTEPTA